MVWMDGNPEDVDLIGHQPVTEIPDHLALPFGHQQPAVWVVQLVQERRARPGDEESRLLDCQNRGKVSFDEGA